jgi:hypothetical protein
MKSNREAPIFLDEIALTAADTEAMRRSAEDAGRLSGAEYLFFLTRASAHVEPSRRTSAGWSPFGLPDAVV